MTGISWSGPAVSSRNAACASWFARACATPVAHTGRSGPLGLASSWRRRISSAPPSSFCPVALSRKFVVAPFPDCQGRYLSMLSSST